MEKKKEKKQAQLILSNIVPTEIHFRSGFHQLAVQCTWYMTIKEQQNVFGASSLYLYTDCFDALYHGRATRY